MQLRCYSCHTPFTVGRAFVNQSLNIMQEDKLVHFDFRCPKCKKATRVSKEQLLHSAPGWEYEPTEKPEEKEKPEVKKETKTKPTVKTKTTPKPKDTTKAKAKTSSKPKPKKN
ncbi:MAG: hypothetical protein WBB69_05780 [Anaerolineales bacterium]